MRADGAGGVQLHLDLQTFPDRRRSLFGGGNSFAPAGHDRRVAVTGGFYRHSVVKLPGRIPLFGLREGASEEVGDHGDSRHRGDELFWPETYGRHSGLALRADGGGGAGADWERASAFKGISWARAERRSDAQLGGICGDDPGVVRRGSGSQQYGGTAIGSSCDL